MRVRLLLVMVGALGLVVAACAGGDEGNSRQAGPTIASNGAPTTVGRPTTSPSVSATSTTSTSVTSTATPTSVEPGSTDAHGSYSSVDLGVLPGTSMAYALDINDDGVVVGVGFLPVDGEASPVAVWWPDLTSGPQRLDIDLGLDQRSGSRALRVNNRGQILVSGGGELDSHRSCLWVNARGARTVRRETNRALRGRLEQRRRCRWISCRRRGRHW